MEKRIKKVLAAVLEVAENEINENASPKTVENWDSLNHMKLIAALEEEFAVRLMEQDILEMQSFKLIKLILAKRLESKSQ